VADLVVTNSGAAAQNVNVTQDGIFGASLFGNNPNAEVCYPNVDLLAVNAGSGVDDYTVNALNGPFTTKLEIEDTSSTKSFVANVFVNSLSELNMDLVNLANPADADRFPARRKRIVPLSGAWCGGNGCGRRMAQIEIRAPGA
jgi:hypothetical protein